MIWVLFFNWILFLLLVGLNIADAFMSILILKQGGSEKNILLAWLIKRIGLLPSMIGAKAIFLVALGIEVYLRAFEPFLLLVQICLVVFYCWVVWRNFDVFESIQINW